LLEREQLKYFSGSVVALGTRTVFVADSFFMRHDLTIADMAEWPRIGVPRYSMSKGETLRLLTRAALLLCLLVAVPLHSSGQIQVLQITSSANFVPGLLKPGSLASIFCTGLQDVPDLVIAQGYPLPRTLAGVKVTFGGVDAPILAVANITGGAYQQIKGLSGNK
jgi:hypothetical protein